MIFNRLIRFTL